MLSVRLAKDPTQEWASSSTAQLGQEDARLSITIPSFVLDLLAGLSPENLKVLTLVCENNISIYFLFS